MLCTAVVPAVTPVGHHLNAALDLIGEPMRLESRALRIADRRSSARLEAMFWQALDEICQHEGLNMDDLATRLAKTKPPHTPFTSTLRAFAVAYFHDNEAASAALKGDRAYLA